LNDKEYAYLKQKIRKLLKLDIDAYKVAQMRRRLEAFVAPRAPKGAVQFCRQLEQNAETQKELKDMLTINVSEFFRDAAQFEQLRSIILPELLQNSPRLNIWTAGCSHGDEPYSVAMILDELSQGRMHRILATDLDPEVLSQAKAGGPYPPRSLQSVSEEQLRTYFTAVGGEGYKIVDTLRKRVNFREHNLLSDPFEHGFDLVICRNVMIYFSEETKDRLFRQFHAALKPNGVYFVGATESLLNARSVGFAPVSPNFYRRSAASDADSREKVAA
jgi:chemotaxis protein methyltransferase CheR